MSSSRTRIHLETPQARLGLRLVDHQRQEVARGMGEIDRVIKPGLYVLEIDAGALVERQYLEVPPEGLERTDIRVEIPSAAPLGGTSTVHEYHGYPSSDLSYNPNRSFGHGGRLVVFMRSLADGGPQPVDVSGLELLDGGLCPLANGVADFKRDDAAGWAGLSADLDPGGYVLRSTRPSQRESEGAGMESVDQSIWIEQDWTTLVFLSTNGSRAYPALEYASIHMAGIEEGFRPYDEHTEPANLALEIALSGLRQGRVVVPRDLEDLMLRSKFGNPMLGIVGAHVLLRSPKPRWRLFDTVLKNLRRLVPHHPDMHALRLMRKSRRGIESDSRVPALGWPPMLLDGYRAVIDRDPAEAKRLIPEYSIADLAASRLSARGPWSIWRSLEDSRLSHRAPLWEGRVHDAVQQVTELSGLVPQSNLSQQLRKSWKRALDEARRPASKRRQQLAEPIPMSSADLADLSSAPASAATAIVAGYIRELVGLSQRYGVEPEANALEVRNLSVKTGLPTATVARAVRNLDSHGLTF